ncbi:MAG: nucleotidyltransferase domain-containing protein [Candidatus Sungbacteria bacterium]|nr:nucleotidyltransferase domain-containing protein [Candidatus Sungbacteria bacterium]
MEKAIRVAEQLLKKYKFVSKVGLFGSTARGENGSDIYLVIIDDGTISLKVLKNLRETRVFGQGYSSSRDSYAKMCCRQLALYTPGGFLGDFFQYIREIPRATDLVFLNAGIVQHREYLDRLALYMRDPFFFRNIREDILLFLAHAKKFGKGFPSFANNGVPSNLVVGQNEWIMGY